MAGARSIGGLLHTGTALDLHAGLREEEWALYQRGMRSITVLPPPSSPGGCRFLLAPGHARRRGFPRLPLGRALSPPRVSAQPFWTFRRR